MGDSVLNDRAKPGEQLDQRQTVLVVQPAVMHYRVPVYNELAKHWNVVVVCNSGRADCGETNFQVRELNIVRLSKFYWQKNVCQTVLSSGANIVWLWTDVNCLSSLALLVYCRYKKIPVVLHGQGLVKQSRVRSMPLRRWMLRVWFHLADRYVAYADVCAESMIDCGFSKKKLCFIQNRFEQAGAELPNPAVSRSCARGVLFVGRLREHCGIHRLIDAMKRINEDSANPNELHVIGGGSFESALRMEYDDVEWIHFHGTIDDQNAIRAIANHCRIGVYPGRAGLSVLTYMKYGLGVVVGSDLSQHMGPEPSYVVDGVNGWTFSNDSDTDFEQVLRRALRTQNVAQIRQSAFETYRQIHRVSYAEEMSRELAITVR